MAKDLELEKSSPESEEAKDKLNKDDEKSKKTDKGAKSEKADKKDKDKDKKAAKGKKTKGPIKYLKDARSEFKKVVWPTPKETTRNTIVVIVVCLLAGLFVFGLDSLFGLLNNLLFK